MTTNIDLKRRTNLLEAGLNISFEGTDRIKVSLKGGGMWWYGTTLEDVYNKTVGLGFVKQIEESSCGGL